MFEDRDLPKQILGCNGDSYQPNKKNTGLWTMKNKRLNPTKSTNMGLISHP
jgi:hypothetical protein